MRCYRSLTVAALLQEKRASRSRTQDIDRVMRCYRSLTVAALLQVEAATVKKRVGADIVFRLDLLYCLLCGVERGLYVAVCQHAYAVRHTQAMTLSEESEKELAADLRSVIAASGETLGRIADRVGVDRTTLWKWKKRPTTESLPKLALFLRRSGKDALAAKFLAAFFDEYPELSGMVVISPTVGKGPGTGGESSGTDIAAASEKIPPSSALCPICYKRKKKITDMQAQMLYNTLDDVLELGEPEVVASLNRMLRSFVRCAKKSRLKR